MFVELEFCRWYLPIVYWRVHLWKCFTNKLIFQMDILLPLEFQFSLLQFQNHSTVLASTSRVLMTSKSFSLVVKVWLNTLARGQQSSWVEKAGMDSTGFYVPAPSRVFLKCIYLFNFFFLCFHSTSGKGAPGLGVVALAETQSFCEHYICL